MKTSEKPLIVEYISLLLMLTLTVLSIFNKSVSVFYLLYLLWWDEILKTLFDLFRYVFKKNQIEVPSLYLKSIKSRFFLLSIYIIFIVIIFGFMINWGEDDTIINNLNAFMFKNAFFNLSLVGFLLREIYLFKNDYSNIRAHHILSKGIITLHLSLILGVFMWFLVTKKLELTGIYPTLVSIIPFLILKLYFEAKEIQYNNLNRLK